MKHVLLDKNNKVVQQDLTGKKPKGFIKAPDHVFPGFVKNGSNWDAPEPTPDQRDYKQKRRAEYPYIGDQLDAIWKELKSRRYSGDTLVKEADDILNEIESVKAKHPKPEA